ncbi:MAG TPA: NDP-sugar synthase [Firmicutes bacterium]|nr:NDP-sugar synthase [Bacillota bacterium]
MKAMILAAGLGTRLRPLTDIVPKPMVPMAGRPCMEYIIRLLQKHGFDDIMVNLHYLPEKITGSFGDGAEFGVKITYSYEEELLGTADGLKKVEDFFAGEPVLLVSGDALTDLDLTAFYRYHQKHGAIATLALKAVADPSQYGVVMLERERITAFQEKPARNEAISSLANTGIYLFTPDIFARIPANCFFDFGRQVFPALLAGGEKMAGYETSAYWCDVGDLAVYRDANFALLAGRVQADVPGEDKGGYIRLGGSVFLARESVVTGPVFIGDECVVAKGAQIYGPAVLGKGCRLEKGAVVKDSILWDHVRVGAGAVVNGCILADGCEIASGMVLEDEVVVEEMLAGRREAAAGKAESSRPGPCTGKSRELRSRRGR